MEILAIAVVVLFIVLVALFLFWPGRIKGVFLKRLPLVILLAVGLNAGHLTRNYSLYGSPLGPGAEGSSGEFKYTNDVISVSATVSNAGRSRSGPTT